jgi:exodeoxyribonuclease V beta subunit
VPGDASSTNDGADTAVVVPVPQSAAEDIYTESQRDALDDVDARDAPPLSTDGTSLHGFPRGAAPGHFLHGLLEWAGRQGFARVRTDPAAQADLSDLVARRCSLRGWESWIDPLRAWLNGWLDTPLRLDALMQGTSPILQVAPIALKQYQVEMEFWFAVSGADTATLDALVQRHTLQGVARTPLLPQQVNGMLKGFIDLVFEHDGRYFVVDYKSNYLGASDSDYTAATMREAILKDRYDLQFVLYIYALHRLLRSRIPDYAYEQHVGGAIYIFLRGHSAATQGLHCERPPLALLEAMDRLFGGEMATRAALEATA